MIQITTTTELRVQRAGGESLALGDVIPLLRLIHQQGSIAAAAQQLGLSYRHAWGRLRALEQLLGGELIAKSRGRGSVLSELGEKLLWADRLREERTQSALAGLSKEVAQELNKLLGGTGGVVRIHASHGYAVDALVDALATRQTVADLLYRENAEAVAALARGECDVAGFHLPTGEFRASCAAPFRPLLDDSKHVLIHLTKRQQGLFLAKGNPKKIAGLADLARDEIRFVNRQPGSGTRMLLDLLLRKNGVDPERVHSQASTELTHSAIAAFVASGMADSGFGVEPAARHFGLDFIPIVEEDYYFACERAKLAAGPLRILLETLLSPSFHEIVGQLAGYDGSQCGEMVGVRSALTS
jgi:molybdate transport repressor ModE-like protein